MSADLSFSNSDWTILWVAAVFCGISKSGLPGVGLLTVVMVAQVIPGQPSSGVLLPMLIAADLLAASQYREHVQWKLVTRLGLPMFVGVLAGTVFMAMTRTQPPALFNRLIGGLVLGLVILQGVRQKWPDLTAHLPHSKIFAWFVGLVSGFATMLANAAGPITSIYLLLAGLARDQFVHTMAWLFLIVNVAKVPFSAGLGLIHFGSLHLNLILIPAVLAGFFAGRRLVQRIPQRVFNPIVILLTLVAAIRLLLL